MVDISILGQRYEVPEGLTILKALEWSGFQMTRGVGCRTVYRLSNDHKLYYALACQTVIKAGMILGEIPFFPAQRPAYKLENLEASGEALIGLYPEILKCFGCNTCSKACPQGIDVLNVMSAVIRGDLPSAAEASFDCIACGLCVARCPSDNVPPNVSLLVRRLYGKYLSPPAGHLRYRLQELEGGSYKAEINGLKSAPLTELRQQYAVRQIEE